MKDVNKQRRSGAFPGACAFSLQALTLALGLAAAPAGYTAPSAQQQLLDQVRLGEASKREDLVRQSLYRLELIAPDDPQVIAARMRYLQRRGDTAGAQKQLERLRHASAGPEAYRAAQVELQIASPEGRQALQQARLQIAGGHLPEGIALYDQLLNGAAPQGDLAIEYWTAVAQIPARHEEAVGKLQALNAQAPGNVQLQATLAKMLFRDGRDARAYAVLEQMSRSSGGRNTAADIWYDRIKNRGASSDSVSALQRFLQIFSSGEQADDARQQLVEWQKQLADPQFRAAADRREQQARIAQAAANAPQTWQIYWPLIRKGDAALKAGNPDAAQRFYQQARRVDPGNSYAVLGLGDVALARGDSVGAERDFLQTLRLDGGNSSAVRRLANLYRQQSPERAEAFISGLTPRQRRSIDDIERSLASDRLAARAASFESEGRWAQAAEVQRRRLALDPDSVWIVYRLVKDLQQGGERAEADTLMRNLARRQPDSPQQVYAVGLYLAAADEDTAALAHLRTLPESRWDDDIRALNQRLQESSLLRKANQLRDGGSEAQAIALLRRWPSARSDITLADWAQQQGDDAAAIRSYRQALDKEPDNGDAHLGLAELYAGEGEAADAAASLARMNTADASLNMQRRMARVKSQIGDDAGAEQIYSRILPQAKAAPPSMESAMVLRDGARWRAQQGNPAQSFEDYKDAMVAAGIAPARPQDNDAFTRLTRNEAKDDWLRRGIRSDAADLYRQQDLNVTLEHNYWGSSGTGGYSDLKAHTTMLQVDAPLADGRMFFRSDVVSMNAGRFATEEDGRYSPKWGTCKDLDCRGGRLRQRDTGTSVAVGWQNATWAMDVGTTPLGFEVTDVVGGLSYSSSARPIGYTVEGHRRPVSSSLLAFGGQKDTRTGTTWGGVRADGGSVSMSYDRGGRSGVWASLGGDTLTGKNVADNWRARWMAGYYYKLINDSNRRVTVGLNNMLWHYDRDLSHYTLGQGGYYSPQQYLSFAVPVNWRQRTENWSWELGGSASWSHSKTRDERRYPQAGLLPDTFRSAGREIIESGSSSSGVGYTAHALVERRITGHWFVGAAVDIQQAKDYTPSHALLYVRYSAAGWQGDMDMPPKPLVPYADW